jgi:hypothetical protein
MSNELIWLKLRFRLLGDMHVGERKWGYVRSGRAYVPGWTIWGALTNFLKRKGRIPGSFERVGNWLNENFWFSHLTLTADIKIKDNDEPVQAAFLPVEARGGDTVFQWVRRGDRSQLPVNKSTPRPMSYRHGVVRQPSPLAGTMGNLFLTEALSGPRLRPFYLEGFAWAAEGAELRLETGDAIAIGGNRTSSNAVLKFECIEPRNETTKNLVLSHLKYLGEKAFAGNLERIVLRRTKENSSGGFGENIVDWGLHLEPGWEALNKPMPQTSPGRERDGWRHGTVELMD